VGNDNQGYTLQDYDTALLQKTNLVRVSRSSTYSKGQNKNRSTQEQVTVVTFAYDANGLAVGNGGGWSEATTRGDIASFSQDGFGNETRSGSFVRNADDTISITFSESSETFGIFGGQARVLRTDTTTHTVDTLAGGSTDQFVSVENS